MIRELILIRHGESQHLVDDLVGGWTDTHLTERGRAQSKAMVERLKTLLNGLEFSVFSSDLHRAAETAQLIAHAFNKEIIYLKDLRELNNGVAVGLSNTDARKIMNPLTEPRVDWVPFEGAESWKMLYMRAGQVLREISSIENERAVVVSHGNTLRCIISAWLGLTLDANVTYDLHTCSITWLRVNQLDERCIRKLNDTGHLVDLSLEDIHKGN